MNMDFNEVIPAMQDELDALKKRLAAVERKTRKMAEELAEDETPAPPKASSSKK